MKEGHIEGGFNKIATPGDVSLMCLMNPSTECQRITGPSPLLCLYYKDKSKGLNCIGISALYRQEAKDDDLDNLALQEVFHIDLGEHDDVNHMSISNDGDFLSLSISDACLVLHLQFINDTFSVENALELITDHSPVAPKQNFSYFSPNDDLLAIGGKDGKLSLYFISHYNQTNDNIPTPVETEEDKKKKKTLLLEADPNAILTVTRQETFVVSDTQLIGLSFHPTLPLLCVVDENNIITIFNYLTFQRIGILRMPKYPQFNKYSLSSINFMSAYELIVISTSNEIRKSKKSSIIKYELDINDDYVNIISILSKESQIGRITSCITDYNNDTRFIGLCSDSGKVAVLDRHLIQNTRCNYFSCNEIPVNGVLYPDNKNSSYGKLSEHGCLIACSCESIGVIPYRKEESDSWILYVTVSFASLVLLGALVAFFIVFLD